MARKANSDTYSTVEASVVAELSGVLKEHIALATCPLFMDAQDWCKVCCGLPRIAHLVAGECDFRLDKTGYTYERRAPLPLGKEERGVGLNTLRDRFAAIIHALDPAGVLWTMAKA